MSEELPTAEPGSSPLPEATTPPALHAYELPGPRKVVSSGLQLASAASRDLRRASLYIGLLTLGLIGPTLVYGMAVVSRYHLTTLDLEAALQGAPGPLSTVVAMVFAASLGFVAVAIDGQLIAVGTLAARAADRPFTLREATTRARQVFWRIVAATIVVSVLNVIVQLAVEVVLGGRPGSTEVVTVVAPIVAVVVLAPLGYVTTGIVLGDVGPWEAIKRSLRLAGARPLTALVVAVFTLLTSAIQVFALSAGLGVLAQVADFFHLGVSSGGVALVATIVGLLAFVVALGSLIVTIAAIVTAPQVAAFLGLTFYSAGLDRARSDAPQRGTFHWVTRPMAALMIVLAIGAASGIVSVDPLRAAAADPIVAALEVATDGASGAVLHGLERIVTDPTGDVTGRGVGFVDVTVAEYAIIPAIPNWLLRSTFACQKATAACFEGGSSGSAYSDGALLVLQRMAAPPDAMGGNALAEWGPVLMVGSHDVAPAGPGPFPLATHAWITRLTARHSDMHFLEYAVDSFHEVGTDARSLWIGAALLTLIPIDEIPSVPLGWDVYAHYAADAGASGSADTLRASDGGTLPVYRDAPLLDLAEVRASP